MSLHGESLGSTAQIEDETRPEPDSSGSTRSVAKVAAREPFACLVERICHRAATETKLRAWGGGTGKLGRTGSISVAILRLQGVTVSQGTGW